MDVGVLGIGAMGRNHRRVLSLPVHPSLTAEDLQYIAEIMNSFEA